MPHDTALEAHEHAEHAEHAAHEADPFIGRVSITIAILAVLAATAGSLETVEAGGAITSSSEAVLKQDQATDDWGFYEAKSIKKNLYAIAADQGGAKAEDYKKTSEKNAKEEEGIQEKAKDAEKERDALLAVSRRHENRHHWLTASATLLEVAIAICTVAIITRRRWFWYGSILLGAVGLAILGYSFLAI